MHSGYRGLLVGDESGNNHGDRSYYSSAYQTIAIPAGIVSATVSFKWYPSSFWDDPIRSIARDIPIISWQQCAPGRSFPVTSDEQYVLIMDSEGANILRTIISGLIDSHSWQSAEADLTEFAGHAIRLHFGVINKGDNDNTGWAMYVDDASLVICWPPTEPGAVYLPLLLHDYALPTPTPTPTATPTGVPPQRCYEGVRNGGFETDDAWVIRDNPVLAAYVSHAHTGARSMRAGIPLDNDNIRSYSPFDQTITLPPGLASAQLQFWRSHHWEASDVRKSGSVLPRAGPLPALADLPQHASELAAAVFATDFFYVIAVHEDDSLTWLSVERGNEPAWRLTTLDLREPDRSIRASAIRRLQHRRRRRQRRLHR